MLKFLKRIFFGVEQPPRHPWRAIRFRGGGILTSPYEMTEEEACMWVSVIVKGEIAYIDRELGFIFYRPKGE